MISESIKQLVNYGISNDLIKEEDRAYTTNLLMDALGVTEYEDKEVPEAPLEEILSSLCDYAVENGKLEPDSIVRRDLFDTRLMGLLTPRPSEVIERFRSLYQKSPKEATDFYYRFSCATDYIRTYRIKKDMRWTVPSEFGEIDITINLSKPEKDPRDIAAAKSMKSASYPKCLLCRETEGFAGNLATPARENHRLIPVTLAGEDWFFQYSPYVYYNEHCIVLSGAHTPMNVCVKTVERMLDFLDLFPHYFIGSNAGLPVVGGSILSHDHMQGGRYTFAMERAPMEKEIVFGSFPGIRTGIVHWPLSVIRLQSEDRQELLRLCGKIFTDWSEYTDEKAMILAYTDGVPHNAITPIARRRGDAYEVDLVLRNNLMTADRPYGLYHPREAYHNIKKENIGLIEVMGLAVLPSRLKKELSILADAISEGKDVRSIPEIAKHADWFERFAPNYTFTKQNTYDILPRETGNPVGDGLRDCGVYPCTSEGREAFARFIDYVNLK
ncbi:MAG: UDP-glucose--hexose-1-phosphate uridylyltransferase [Ruminococcus sp.]|nr:UDP-glucose--hexose-1-phosphate uridylyltransferase [Candidatus Apopatosoma intestinale]